MLENAIFLLEPVGVMPWSGCLELSVLCLEQEWPHWGSLIGGGFVSPKDRQRGAAGEAAAGVAGLLRDRGRGAGGHAEELPPAQPPAGDTDGGEVAGPVPADPALHVPVRRRGGRG